jgi:hypothetical protein
VSRAPVLLGLLTALAACTADPGARVLEHHGRWESGYGVEFFNVVGRLRNTSGHALAHVKLRLEAVDAKGEVVASTDAYNESAEALAVPDLDAQAKAGLQQRLKPIPSHGEERFRGSFLKDETPPFTDYRVVVVETPAAPRP